MPPNVTVEENWVVEPELQERPPRRVVSSDFPDLNRPNVVLFCILGALLVVGGILLFTNGMAQKKLLYDFLGVLGVALGIASLVYFPYKSRLYFQRAERLVSFGMPVAARLLSAENLHGSVYARSVRYQVTLPGGELTHRQINADDRALPRRIPGNVTALLDPQSGDMEIYCALPFRAAARPVAETVAAPTSFPPATPAAGGGGQPTGGMQTLGNIAPPKTRVPPPAESAEKPKKRESYE